MVDEAETWRGDASSDPLIGRTLNQRYRVDRRISEGGMSRIYEAHQISLGRKVAIKIPMLDAPGSATSDFSERFLSEARLSSQLTHPNTVRVLEFGRDQGNYFIAMEYIDGTTLSELVRQAGALDSLRVIQLGIQLCGSLAEAHSFGIVHRDLKPTNLMLTEHLDGTEHLRVLDFGIAKMMRGSRIATQAGLMLGTPGYMSPEQIIGKPVTARSDIYGVGALLYLMCTGKAPFAGENIQRILYRQLHEPPTPFAVTCQNVAVPYWLEWITMQCLERSPERRFATVSQVAIALRACQSAMQCDNPGFALSLDTHGMVVEEGSPDAAKAIDSWSEPHMASLPSMPSSFTLSTPERKSWLPPVNPVVPLLFGLAISMVSIASALALLTLVVLWARPDPSKSPAPPPAPTVGAPSSFTPPAEGQPTEPDSEVPPPAPTSQADGGQVPPEPEESVVNPEEEESEPARPQPMVKTDRSPRAPRRSVERPSQTLDTPPTPAPTPPPEAAPPPQPTPLPEPAPEEPPTPEPSLDDGMNDLVDPFGE